MERPKRHEEDENKTKRRKKMKNEKKKQIDSIFVVHENKCNWKILCMMRHNQFPIWWNESTSKST